MALSYVDDMKNLVRWTQQIKHRLSFINTNLYSVICYWRNQKFITHRLVLEIQKSSQSQGIRLTAPRMFYSSLSRCVVSEKNEYLGYTKTRYRKIVQTHSHTLSASPHKNPQEARRPGAQSEGKGADSSFFEPSQPACDSKLQPLRGFCSCSPKGMVERLVKHTQGLSERVRRTERRALTGIASQVSQQIFCSLIWHIKRNEKSYIEAVRLCFTSLNTSCFTSVHPLEKDEVVGVEDRKEGRHKWSQGLLFHTDSSPSHCPHRRCPCPLRLFHRGCWERAEISLHAFPHQPPSASCPHSSYPRALFSRIGRAVPGGSPSKWETAALMCKHSGIYEWWETTGHIKSCSVSDRLCPGRNSGNLLL